MSSQNLDLVRSIYAAWEGGDYGAVEWADPEIEFVIADGLEPGSGKGVEGMADRWRKALSAWDDLRVEAEGYRELDDERVLVLTRMRGRGKSSGVEIVESRGSLFHVHDGMVTRLVLYWDRDRALADLGLGSQTDDADGPPG